LSLNVSTTLWREREVLDSFLPNVFVSSGMSGDKEGQAFLKRISAIFSCCNWKLLSWYDLVFLKLKRFVCPCGMMNSAVQLKLTEHFTDSCCVQIQIRQLSGTSREMTSFIITSASIRYFLSKQFMDYYVHLATLYCDCRTRRLAKKVPDCK